MSMDQARPCHVLKLSDPSLCDSNLVMSINSCKRESLSTLFALFHPLVGFEDTIVSVVVHYLTTHLLRGHLESFLALDCCFCC